MGGNNSKKNSPDDSPSSHEIQKTSQVGDVHDGYATSSVQMPVTDKEVKQNKGIGENAKTEGEKGENNQVISNEQGDGKSKNKGKGKDKAGDRDKKEDKKGKKKEKKEREKGKDKQKGKKGKTKEKNKQKENSKQEPTEPSHVNLIGKESVRIGEEVHAKDGFATNTKQLTVGENEIKQKAWCSAGENDEIKEIKGDKKEGKPSKDKEDEPDKEKNDKYMKDEGKNIRDKEKEKAKQEPGEASNVNLTGTGNTKEADTNKTQMYGQTANSALSISREMETKNQTKLESNPEEQNDKQNILEIPASIDGKNSSNLRNKENIDEARENTGSSDQNIPEVPARPKRNEELDQIKAEFDKIISEKDKEVVEKLQRDLEEKDSELERKLKDDAESKSKEIEQLQRKINEITEERRKIKLEKSEKSKNIKALEKQKDSEILAMKNEMKKLKKEKDAAVAKKEYEIRQLEKEKGELLIRLSEMAGRRLTDNNPNIADLSDINRPTKLAEKYAELYDNEWTDVFQYLESIDGYKESEQKVITALMKMLTTAYIISLKTAEEQLDALRNILSEFHLSTTTHKQEAIDVLKQLKDKRKRVIFPSKVLSEKYKKEIGKEFPTLDYDALKPYTQKCLELCWLMAIQDPPVHLKCEGCKKGDVFDKNMFKEYTQAGPLIKFTVWPAVLLEKDGPLLCKGVVQCDKNLSGSLRTPGRTVIDVKRKSSSVRVSGEKLSLPSAKCDTASSDEGNKRSNTVVEKRNSKNQNMSQTNAENTNTDQITFL